MEEYTKPALSIEEQIERLKKRGLRIADESRASHYLSNISFYRLRAYTYPHQDNNNPDHPFTKEISFEEIIDLYVFDRKLRLLLLDSLEKIEISFRTQLIYKFSLNHDSSWYCNRDLFKSADKFIEHESTINKELDRSTEDFIKHYNTKYDRSQFPPSWMTLEILSLGTLSKMYSNISSSCGTKKSIARYYGLKSESILENWIHCFSQLRNTCAHHSRVFNRRFQIITIPDRPIYKFPNGIDKPYKVYAYISCIAYILKIINPNNTFKGKLKNLLTDYPVCTLKEMGFPMDWENDLFWQ